jgi:hypothetical protein
MDDLYPLSGQAMAGEVELAAAAAPAGRVPAAAPSPRVPLRSKQVPGEAVVRRTTILAHWDLYPGPCLCQTARRQTLAESQVMFWTPLALLTHGRPTT